jgi:predicted ribosomally synthesized peptide with nif11-like leader
MSRREVDRFLSDLQNNAGLRQEVATLGQDMEACVHWANAQGYQFTLEEALETGVFDSDLSDDDLEQVAGGWCGNETTTG